MPDRLPPTLQAYVDHIARAARPLGFLEIVEITPHYNGFRHLKSRGLIVDVSIPYRADEPYDGPRPSMFVLTEKGWSYAASPE